LPPGNKFRAGNTALSEHGRELKMGRIASGHRAAKTPLELRTISTHNAQNEFVKENARGYIHDECRANFVMTAQTRSARSGGIGFTLTSLLFL
jgi:hypothetical protein